MSISVPMFEDPADLIAHLQGQVREDHDGDRGEFYEALDLDVSHIDERARVEDVRILDVEIDGDAITVNYVIDYSVYHGCRDMDGSDSYYDFVRGVADDGQWVFDEWQPLPQRTTVDEF